MTERFDAGVFFLNLGVFVGDNCVLARKEMLISPMEAIPDSPSHQNGQNGETVPSARHDCEHGLDVAGHKFKSLLDVENRVEHWLRHRSSTKMRFPFWGSVLRLTTLPNLADWRYGQSLRSPMRRVQWENASALPRDKRHSATRRLKATTTT